MARTTGCACESRSGPISQADPFSARPSGNSAEPLHEHPGYRQVQIRDRPAGAAQGGCDAAARAWALHRRHQPARTGPRLHAEKQHRARPDQVDRHIGSEGDEGRARNHHRRGRQALRHLAIGATVQEQGWHRPQEAAAAGIADRQGALLRRPDRLRGGRDLATSQGRRRGDQRRHRAAAGRDHAGASHRAERARAVRGRAGQHLPRLSLRRRRQGRSPRSPARPTGSSSISATPA